jgi:site-specific recombinase XerD
MAKTIIAANAAIGTDNFNMGIKRRIKNIKDEMAVNGELKNKVINKIVEKIIVDDCEHDFNVAQINFFNEAADFLDGQNSAHTKNNYKKSINDYISWCQNNGINCLKIKRTDVERFLIYLIENYSSNSVRTKIMGICSLYKFLMHRHNKLFLINPFLSLKLPKIIPTRKIDFVTDNDIKELKKELKRIGRTDIICIVNLICKYGFRVGIFENMKINKLNGQWRSVSKGAFMKGRFTKKELNRIYDTDCLSLNKTNISVIIKRYTEKLFNKKIIGSSFSVHDLRHYFITKYGKNMTVEEFVKFSKSIHKNISTTFSYLNI